MQKRTSYLLAIITMIFWGTAFAFSKLIINKAINPVVFLALRMLFAFVFCFGYLLLTKQIGEWFAMFRRNFWRTLFLGGGFYAFSYIIQYFGVRYTTAINQTIICNASTFFVVMLNLIIYRHKPTRKFVISMIVGFFGILLIMVNEEFHISQTTLIGDLLTLLSFFLWALYLVLNRDMTTKENPLFVTVSMFLWTSVLLVPLSFGFGMNEQFSLLNLIDWGVIAYLGIICSGVGTLLFSIALSNEEIPSENMALIHFLLPIVGITTSILVLGEELNWRIVVGCIIVLFSVFIIEAKKEKLSE